MISLVQSALASYVDGSAPDHSTQVVALVLRHRAEMREIAHRHRGSHLRVFGSVVRGEAREGSDLDLLVDLEPGATLFDLARMRAAFEHLLDMPVDVVASSGPHGDTPNEVLAEALSL